MNFRSCIFKVFRKYIIGTTCFVAFQPFNCGLYFDWSKQIVFSVCDVINVVEHALKMVVPHISDIYVTSGPFHVVGKGWWFPAMFRHMSPEGRLIFTNRIVGERVCFVVDSFLLHIRRMYLKFDLDVFISSYSVPCLAFPEMIQQWKASRASAWADFNALVPPRDCMRAILTVNIVSGYIAISSIMQAAYYAPI